MKISRPYRLTDASLDELEERGLILGHLRHRGYDPELPGSLSADVIDELLRVQMNFDGVVVTANDFIRVANPFHLFEPGQNLVGGKFIGLQFLCVHEVY